MERPATQNRFYPAILLALTNAMCVLSGCSTLHRLGISRAPMWHNVPSPSQHSVSRPAATPAARAACSPKVPKPTAVQIVAYNTHLLPSIALPFAGQRSQSDYRAVAIANQLARFNLIGLCEVFDSALLQRLVSTLEAQSEEDVFVAYGPQRSGTHLISGGLLLASRFPIIESRTITFRSRTRIVTHGLKADGFAAKGVLYAKLRVNEQHIDCFLTHLDSQSEQVRTRQVAELGSFVNELADRDTPTIVMGDMNIKADKANTLVRESEYRNLASTLASNLNQPLSDVGACITSGPAGSSDALDRNGGIRIDYIFVASPPSNATLKIEQSTAKHLPLLDPKVSEGSLSDHLAVTCSITVEH